MKSSNLSIGAERSASKYGSIVWQKTGLIIQFKFDLLSGLSFRTAPVFRFLFLFRFVWFFFFLRLQDFIRFQSIIICYFIRSHGIWFVFCEFTSSNMLDANDVCSSFNILASCPMFSFPFLISFSFLVNSYQLIYKSSALRSLYPTRIRGNKKTYQIFNKVNHCLVCTQLNALMHWLFRIYCWSVSWSTLRRHNFF